MAKKLPLILLGTIIILSAGYLGYTQFFLSESSPPGVSTGIPISIPNEILDNKYGFLSGQPNDAEMIKERGALWARPHAGPFLWDSMQPSQNDPISFTKTDEIVKKHQQQGIGTLVTLWPFAGWDQQNRPNADRCRVSDTDQFLPDFRFLKKHDYLPRYRCNPNDWNRYLTWVSAVVERYNGNGTNDMPGLQIPIKYWEVMNEPDLNSSNKPEPEGEGSLDFYNQDASAYVDLLIKTSKAIRETDPEAKILIAGAAGGNNEFLGFYRQVFNNPQVSDAFDIANVHCISNDHYQSFNVQPYQQLLREHQINKPVWVTEAEAIISSEADTNASQTFASTQKATNLGAERIFFTRFEFEDFGGKGHYLPPDAKPASLETTITGKDARAA